MSLDVQGFINFRPTRQQWNDALNTDWDGPDGSTSSTDHIFGVKIGETSTDFEDRNLPANLHDWRYYLGRKFSLGPRHRHAADVAYREDCIAAVKDALDGRSFIMLATLRAYARYAVLRLLGRSAFTA